MVRRVGKKNHVKVDPLAYNTILLGQSGIGKSTIIKEVCEKLVGEDGYIFFEMDKESGADAIEGIIYEDVHDWNEFEEFKDEIIENRSTDYKDLKVVVIDTYDGFIDLEGEYIPGKSTLVICSDNTDNLKFLCGVLNSNLAIFYIKSKYASSSYCGGITFSKDMINNFPLSSNPDFKDEVVSIVDKILDLGYSIDLNKQLNKIIYSNYNLSSTEIKIIEQSI